MSHDRWIRYAHHRLLAWGLCACICVVSGAARAQTATTTLDNAAEAPSASSVYRESALRRFEVITFVSLPFTSIHSYLVVRSVRMVQANSLAAGVEDSDWNWVGAGALGFSLAIATYDWYRLRGKDRNEPLLPELPVTPPLEPTSRSSRWMDSLCSPQEVPIVLVVSGANLAVAIRF